MVSPYVEFTRTTPVRGVWYTSTTLCSTLHLAYYYQRELSEFETTSRKLDAVLLYLSSEVGVWEEEGDEDVS
jgi:hypothetical protein